MRIQRLGAGQVTYLTMRGPISYVMRFELHVHTFFPFSFPYVSFFLSSHHSSSKVLVGVAVIHNNFLFAVGRRLTVMMFARERGT